jgi:DNA polymerase I-like protein with 3'-5' exonuclease and polymerase domains
MKLPRVTTSFGQLTALREKLEGVARFGLDYEATSKFQKYERHHGLEHDMLKVLGVGFGFEDGERTYVPLAHTYGDNVDKAVFIPILEKVLQDPKKEFFAHNLKYEYMVSRVLGITPKAQLRCSMIAQWLLGYRLDKGRGLQLKPAAQKFLRHRMLEWKDVVSGRMQPEDSNPQEMANYCSDDALQCLRLGMHFIPELHDMRLWDAYTRLEMPFIPVLVHMKECGMALDIDYLNGLHDTLQQEMARLEEEFFSYTGVGISKNQKISKLMYDDRKWWPSTGFERGKAGYFSIDKAHLEKVSQRLEPDSTPFLVLKLKQRYQTVSKLDSTYTYSLAEKAMMHEDQRLRGEFHQGGTDTGRLSCVSGDTVLATTRGSFKIADYEVEPGDKILTHRGRYRPILRKIVKGLDVMYRVTLDSGRSIDCTKEHRFLTLSGWANLGSLVLGDEVCCVNIEEAYERSHIVSITPLGAMVVYDIEVGEDHSYVAHGFINHNSSKPNLQNIPSRSEMGKQIRGAFRAAAGWVLCDADYSQADLVMMGHLSQDPMLLSAYREGRDLHQQTADHCSEASGLEVSRPTGKVLNLGLIYEMGQKTLMKNLGSEYEVADKIWRAWHYTYPLVGVYHRRMHEFARQFGFVRTITGRIRRIPDINSRNHAKRAFAERCASNTPDQGSVSDVIKIAMRNLYWDWLERGILYDYYTGRGKAKILSQVHDEIICELKVGFEEEGMADIRRHLENAVELRAPMTAQPGIGLTWTEAKNDVSRREDLAAAAKLEEDPKVKEELTRQVMAYDYC